MARRKRIDPDDLPETDLTQDIVLNPEPGKRYVFVSVEDQAVMTGRGFVRTERREGPDATRPAFDVGQGDGGYIINGQLMLMEAPEERAQAIQARGERRFAEQIKGLRDSVKTPKEGRYASVGPVDKPLGFLDAN